MFGIGQTKMFLFSYMGKDREKEKVLSLSLSHSLKSLHTKIWHFINKEEVLIHTYFHPLQEKRLKFFFFFLKSLQRSADSNVNRTPQGFHGKHSSIKNSQPLGSVMAKERDVDWLCDILTTFN